MPSTAHTLPQELADHIIDLVSTTSRPASSSKDLVNCTLVCRAWMLRASRHLLRRVSLLGLQFPAFLALVQRSERFQTSVEDLCILGAVDITQHWDALLTALPKLAALELWSNLLPAKDFTPYTAPAQRRTLATLKIHCAELSALPLLLAPFEHVGLLALRALEDDSCDDAHDNAHDHGHDHGHDHAHDAHDDDAHDDAHSDRGSSTPTGNSPMDHMPIVTTPTGPPAPALSAPLAVGRLVLEDCCQAATLRALGGLLRPTAVFANGFERKDAGALGAFLARAAPHVEHLNLLPTQDDEAPGYQANVSSWNSESLIDFAVLAECPKLTSITLDLVDVFWSQCLFRAVLKNMPSGMSRLRVTLTDDQWEDTLDILSAHLADSEESYPNFHGIEFRGIADGFDSNEEAQEVLYMMNSEVQERLSPRFSAITRVLP
ncbi:hypothetical protein PsYK624_115240 [Phanerochaete sordida]|uniref:F-box domain-containing protein n=1 Tax=Phanerochaete sordida TaxID=48140 RepID=A0A9P3GKS0_9APHY|nr:hypothetical protein PsYK624_115240 [Phanerochaete sordida]